MTKPLHPGLRVIDAGPLRTVTLCDPRRRNAQTPSLWSALASAATGTPAPVRVFVIASRARSPLLEAPPDALRELKALLRSAGEASRQEQLGVERRALSRLPRNLAAARG